MEKGETAINENTGSAFKSADHDISRSTRKPVL